MTVHRLIPRNRTRLEVMLQAAEDQKLKELRVDWLDDLRAKDIAQAEERQLAEIRQLFREDPKAKED